MCLSKPLANRLDAGQPGDTAPTSAVLRSVDARTNSDVAIRLIRTPLWLSDEERSDRLRRLAGALEPQVEVRHPHLAAVRQVQTAGSSVQVVRDWVEGLSLEATLRRHGPMRLDEVIFVAGQVASALDCLARSGLSHGALTLGNVVATPHGDVCLTDAGIRAVYGSSFTLGGRRALYTGLATEADDVRALAKLVCALLAGVPEGYSEGVHGAVYRVPVRGRLALERALAHGRAAFDLALPLAQMLDPVHRPSLWQVAWRPAAAVGAFAILTTLTGTALPEQEQHRPVARTVAADAAPAPPARPAGEEILGRMSADDIDVLRAASRRMGPALLARPVVADAFELSDAQRERIQAVLEAHRRRVEQVVNSAVSGSAVDTGTAMREARAEARTRVLRVLDEDQRAAWKSIAEDGAALSGGF